MNKNGTLFWITGLSNSGKTTIGTKLYYELKKDNPSTVILDGDSLKKIVSEDLGYTNEDRLKKAKRNCQLCRYLTSQGIDVIICTIAMMDEIRAWNKENIENYIEVFLDVDIELLKYRDKKGLYADNKNIVGLDLEVEFPKNPDITIKNDGTYSIDDCVNIIKSFFINKKNNQQYNADVKFWNNYHINNMANKKSDKFASYIYNNFIDHSNIKNSSLLEIGCGKGEDSVFFANKGIDVSSLDISDTIIKNNISKFKIETLNFYCDDCSKTLSLYEKKYDYCFCNSLFEILSEDVKFSTIKQIKHSLKKNGLFFIQISTFIDMNYNELITSRIKKFNLEKFKKFLLDENLDIISEKKIIIKNSNITRIIIKNNL